MINIQQPCSSNVDNRYQPNHYYPSTNTGVPANNNIEELYPINSPMSGYPTHNYNHIPAAQPISSNANHGYQTNNNYIAEMNTNLTNEYDGAGVGNPYISQPNVPVYNAADDFDQNQLETPIPNTQSLTRILDDFQYGDMYNASMQDILTSMEKIGITEIHETNIPY